MEPERQPTRLEFLANKYGTDKLQHGYIPFYEKYLPKNPKKILEIGVKEGASIRMWRDWFGEKTQVHGLDLFVENCIPQDLYTNSENNVWFWKGNQCDHYLLEQLRKENFDVIIDDGSHNSRDQMMTFFGLMHKDCHYFIEDIHCCGEEFYQDGLPLGLTAKKIFSENDFRYAATYHHESPIVLIQSSTLCI